MYTVLLPVATALIIIGAALNVSAGTGQMALIGHLKEDWTQQLPFRLRYNRYNGFSRTCYQILAILYYISKAIVILAICGACCIFTVVCTVFNRIWRKIKHS